MNPVPVFLYHSVADDPPSWIAPFTVAPRAFVEQLDRIADAGLTVVPLRRLVAALRGGPALPPRSAVLTFDDGFADFYWTVTPILTDRELPATLYVTTGAVHPPGGTARGSLLPGQCCQTRTQSTFITAESSEAGGAEGNPTPRVSSSSIATWGTCSVTTSRATPSTYQVSEFFSQSRAKTW